MGEDIGADMCLRTFDHLLQYGEPVVRRAVPLSLGLHSISNPRLEIMDTLRYMQTFDFFSMDIYFSSFGVLGWCSIAYGVFFLQQPVT